MLDLVLTNGLVVTPSGAKTLDIGIAGGKIVSLRETGLGHTEEATRTVDLRGQLVVPGGVDPHVHTNSVLPTAAESGIKCFGPDRVSEGAIYGGTTTLVDFAHWQPGDELSESFARKSAEWAGSSYTDYALHGTFKEPEIPFEVLEQIPDAVAAGHGSYKVWMTNTTPTRPKQKTDLGNMWGLMQQTAQAGAMLAVHAEDDDIVMYAYKQLQREGRIGLENMHHAHNNLSEKLSFQRVITLAEHVGAPIYLMHVSAREGVDAIREARGRGQAVYGEILPHYAYFTAEDYKQKNGAIYHTYPSLKSETDRDSMWESLLEGSLSTLATDGVCTDLEVKTRGKTILDATGGHAGVEMRMAVAYTEGVAKRGLDLTRFVDITSANAAKILGLYPQKGVIAVGSDADLAVLDTTVKKAIHAEDLHEADYTPWDGYEVAAWPSMTVLRGQVMVENRELKAEAGGSLLKQHVSSDVRNRPAC
ncbi:MULTISPECIES: dihydroorotase [Arthrobacter]|jgi:dihydropyrimidinase|uniref:Dihydropyrimidinase n=1 Tax=Arthrobacter bambusae TaxID=1338426 RepID=A0AAW8DLM8_9MICC|nr:amidohydrolase family protein [Arthrobacter bambusae]MDP9907216.1 dihydropyrimidinase [Arthrobacter bambusae]MDQ0131297.1 dihydropyrimidinase [Arthrobacter bambusae]MDQ0182630.1 dihydropyrimidinase [Arthrobacter bambusae]